MFSTLKGMLVTLTTTLRKPVTAQYPKQHLPIQPRYMGFPALTWDYQVDEPYVLFFIIAPDGLCYCIGERRES